VPRLNLLSGHLITKDFRSLFSTGWYLHRKQRSAGRNYRRR